MTRAARLFSLAAWLAILTLAGAMPAWGQSGGAPQAGGAYVRGSLGYSWSPEDEIDYSPLWGIGAGYQFTPAIRADVTADWRDRYLVEGGRGFLGGREVDSKVDNRTVMVNLYYDFPGLGRSTGADWLRPYVGGGLGWSRTRVDDVTVLDPDSGTLDEFIGDDETQFAWQLAAGVRYDTPSGLVFDFGYRYADLGDVQLTSVRGDVASGLTAHELVTSIGYRF